MVKNFIRCSVLLFIVVFNPLASEDFQRFNVAFELLINQEYQRSSGELMRLLEDDPSDFDALYFSVAVEQTRILDYDSYNLESARFVQYADSVRTSLENTLGNLTGSDSVRCAFYIANITGGIGIIQAKAGRWFDAVRNAISSVNTLRDLTDKDPTLAEAKLGIGVFDYYLSNSLRWVPFTENRAKRGIKAVRDALNAPSPFDLAAKNSLCWILIDEEEFAEADSLAQSVLDLAPENTIFLKIRALIALWTGRYSRAEKLALQLIDASDSKTPVNWSDLVTGYYILINCHQHNGREAELVRDADKILGRTIPPEFKDVSHIESHLKHIRDTSRIFRVN
ncbi:hypothetical protein QA601_09230 [Chitinispirillales bacterium ANBcel5]|uniref:tetratricopeptide repeat protein n=1 Tax=Cellulosispirillum alkaliphilum TaxID=3039283 RepID=UPI002A4FEDD6|nr:hypothetical protein [Chitinispirillales bacterium ANBcel5]